MLRLLRPFLAILMIFAQPGFTETISQGDYDRCVTQAVVSNGSSYTIKFVEGPVCADVYRTLARYASTPGYEYLAQLMVSGGFGEEKGCSGGLPNLSFTTTDGDGKALDVQTTCG